MKQTFLKNEPTILTVTGLVGMGISLIWAIKTTVDATHIIDAEKQKQGVMKLSKKELFKKTWKLYLPVVLSTGLSTASIIAGHHISEKRGAAMAAAYTVASSALQTYQSKVAEIAGSEVKKQVETAIATDQVTEADAKQKDSDKTMIVFDGGNDVLFVDEFGYQFYSNTNKVVKAMNDIITKSNNGYGTFSVGDFYSALGLKPGPIYDSLGWTSVAAGGKGFPELKFEPSENNGKLCYKIWFNIWPTSLV